MKTIRLTVRGKVQGVYFRASAKNVADQLRITGWIKNLPDNNVEIKATSSEELLQQFIGWCKQGPPGAIVDEVIIEDLLTEPFTGLRIMR